MGYRLFEWMVRASGGGHGACVHFVMYAPWDGRLHLSVDVEQLPNRVFTAVRPDALDGSILGRFPPLARDSEERFRIAAGTSIR